MAGGRPKSGAVQWFVFAVTDQLTQYGAAINVANSANEWLVRLVPQFQAHQGLWFQRVLLYEEALDLEAALTELKAMLERYPKHRRGLPGSTCNVPPPPRIIAPAC